jgi:hypothetical protein
VRIRALVTAASVAAALLATGCSTASTAPGPAATRESLPPDPHTASALLAIATTFNHDFDTGDYGPVWDRWDARSQAVISRAEYIQRNVDCHTQRPLSQTESDGPGPHGAWLVHYEIDGEQLTDYWFYVGYRWVFDLVRSNPDMVPVYRMSPAQYVAAVGCAH